VQEFIQHDATGEKIAAEITRIVEDGDYRRQMKQDLQAVKRLLGEGGGSSNLARLAAEMLEGTC